MTDSEAIAKAQKERDMARYLSETSPYPGIQAVHRNKYEWLSCIIRLAQKTLNDTEKPNTRADRIRAMSDEELANWLARTQYENIMEAAEIFGTRLPFKEETLKGSEQECLQWLKQPAKKGADNG